ncbi:unnamed protein product [Kluyveromyces dobzhanskii CBS 2104]|uniref:Structural maintenance of chromosomes protein n=1 Tax=Kluyveromyces dobzhanskii CBS 2104 TaxID=1427455 RepID=A0A0A8L3H9_9SACH|nr:unnamed protein product [Kluyveromyces dobzhanskii CBS 2104]
MGRLIGLELHNFKSYKDTVRVGFGESYFTSIIGPNGSGKSNLMDAISFVLGVRSNQLRSSALVDLIYRGRIENDDPENGSSKRVRGSSTDPASESGSNDSQGDEPRSAYVSCVYQKDDNNEPTKFTRTINTSGDSHYKIDEKTVSYKKYNEELESENILVKARNFLVFQGDVERIASQGPESLTLLLEQVSGSINYKFDYERLKEEHKLALAEFTDAHNARKKVQNDLKSFKEGVQRDEQYRTSLETRDQLKNTYIIWELFHILQKRKNLVDTLTVSKTEMAALKNKLSDEERLLTKIKSTTAKHELQLTKLKDTLTQVENEKTSLQSSLLPVGSERLATIKRIHNLEKRVSSFERDIERQQTYVKQFENQLKVVSKTKKTFEKELENIHANLSKFNLSAEDLEQYELLKEKYLSSSGSQIEEKLAILKNDEFELNEEKALFVKRLKSTRERITDELQVDAEALESDLNEVIQRLNDKNSTAANESKEWKMLQTNLENFKNKEFELNFKLRDVLLKIDDLNADQRETKKERKLRENVTMLKRLYPGVKGLVNDLCHPKKEKYAVAVSTILGKNFDSIVVDSIATAHECISYLKKQRAGSASFIPLDTIDVNAPSLPVSNVQGCLLTINAIEYEGYLEKAMQYVCSDSIICDSLDVAKEIKWSKNVKAKLVTLDGALIHKAGQMTGGTSQKNQNRWNKDEYQGLMVLKDQITEELHALSDKIRVDSMKSRELENEISLLNNEISGLRTQISQLERTADGKNVEIKHNENLISIEIEPQIESLDFRIDTIRSKISKLESEKDVLQEQIFKPFTEKYGFSIKDYEKGTGEIMRKHSKELQQFQKEILTIENKLEFENDRLKVTTARHTKALADLDTLKETLGSLERQEDKITEKVKSIDSKISQEQLLVASQQKVLDEKVHNLISFDSNIAEIQANMQAARRKVDEVKEDIERLDIEQLSILKNCKVSNVDLPLLNSSLDDISIENLDSNNTSIVADLDYDFSSLAEKYRQSDGDEVKEEFISEIKKIEEKLEVLQPNSKAVQRYDETKDKLNQVSNENEKLRNKERKAKEKFLEIKQKRKELFEACFNHVDKHIDKMYRALTKNPHDKSELAGGNASLTVDNEDEPYLGGIKYFATPPMKRFKDMEYLSGGEKTMAALALLFTINSFQPSPFFVLDEVDAALDITNVERIAHYIKRNANPQSQFIVISLKNAMFEKSQSLVGIFREQEENSSKMISLNLENYDED